MFCDYFMSIYFCLCLFSALPCFVCYLLAIPLTAVFLCVSLRRYFVPQHRCYQGLVQRHTQSVDIFSLLDWHKSIHLIIYFDCGQQFFIHYPVDSFIRSQVRVLSARG